MKPKKILILLFVLLSLIFISGCTIRFSTKGKKSEEGGIFLSYEKGSKWQAASFLLNSNGEKLNFQQVDINFLKMDPTDNLALSAGSAEGLYYTFNVSQGWQLTLTNLGNLNDLAIDSKNHCTIYAAVNNRIYKSKDCARHWDYTFIEQGAPAVINTMAVDSYDPKNIYAGTANNGFFRSEDEGQSWHVIKFFDSPIINLLITPSDTRIIYVVTQNNGIFKTTDSGSTWSEITANLQKAIEEDKINRNCGNIREYKNLIFDPQNDARLLYASRCLFETTDRGESWQQIKLLTKPSETNIYGLAISYHNANEIFYGTKTTFYRSTDNGQNWITKDLPTSRAAAYLLTDPINPTLIYLGTKNYK